MQGLYDLPTTWLNYLREHMVLPGPSVEKLKELKNPRLGHFSPSFSSLQTTLQLGLGRYVKSVSLLCSLVLF